MNFLFVIEDPSGKEMLKILVPKLISLQKNHSTVHYYHGIGSIPPKTAMAAAFNEAEKKSGIVFQTVKTNTMLDDFRRLLSVYADTYQNQDCAVVVVCDLDTKDKTIFLKQLNDLVDSCPRHPATFFCLAIEEGEAWFLGDIEAIKKAYPRCNIPVLQSYKNDSICGTWEKLADAVYPGGHVALTKKGHSEVGKTKNEWAITITPYMDVERNKSPSFCFFRDTVRNIAK